MDLLDRQFLLMSSGHWTWKTMAYLVGTVVAVLALGAAVVLALGLFFGAPGTALLSGAGFIGGASVAAIRRRNRASDTPPTQLPEERGEEDPDTRPRAA
ncbi:hypothetical protein ACQPXH_33215 (plasmid) [Nocardia sp. CA-135953]|uniref:hypothetical protein n=1 Tax=Nocardia sp. CA-135953 TaxID=3239978 RepID=UPI003D966864